MSGCSLCSENVFRNLTGLEQNGRVGELTDLRISRRSERNDASLTTGERARGRGGTRHLRGNIREQLSLPFLLYSRGLRSVHRLRSAVSYDHDLRRHHGSASEPYLREA